MQPNKVGTRTLKAGQVLLKPGDKVTSVFVLQSGRLSICQPKNGKTIEILQLEAPSVLCEEAIFGALQWQFTALALRELVVVEIPVSLFQEQLRAAGQAFNLLFKGASDRAKSVMNDLKALQSAREVVACPPDHTAKAFGVLFHSARIVGRRDGEAVVADWTEFRKYATEVFEEPTARLEDAVNVLVKLGYASFESASLRIAKMSQLEAFFDYFGNYHFKPGYSNFLKTNTTLWKIAEEFLKVAANYPVDRGGNAHLPYKPAIDAMKKSMGKGFEADQLFRLEQKGLFIKRQSTQDGGTLSFYKPDFEQMLQNWEFLREIEHWNEKGYVEPSERPAAGTAPAGAAEADAERKRWAEALASWQPAVSATGAPQLRSGEKKEGEVWCSVCMSVVNQGQKACQVCGAELDKKAA